MSFFDAGMVLVCGKSAKGMTTSGESVAMAEANSETVMLRKPVEVKRVTVLEVLPAGAVTGGQRLAAMIVGTDEGSAAKLCILLVLLVSDAADGAL